MRSFVIAAVCAHLLYSCEADEPGGKGRPSDPAAPAPAPGPQADDAGSKPASPTTEPASVAPVALTYTPSEARDDALPHGDFGDFEFLQIPREGGKDLTLINYVKGTVGYVSRIDPATGELVDHREGPATVRFDDDVREFRNGPEFGLAAGQAHLHYVRFTAQREPQYWVAGVTADPDGKLTASGKGRVASLAILPFSTIDPKAPFALTQYLHAKDGTPTTSLKNVTAEVVVAKVGTASGGPALGESKTLPHPVALPDQTPKPRSIAYDRYGAFRWAVGGPPGLASAVFYDDALQRQGAVFDWATGEIEAASAYKAGEAVDECWLSYAPELAGDLVLWCTVGDERFDFFRKVDGAWTLFRSITVPSVTAAGVTYRYAFSPEVVLHAGRSYILFYLNVSKDIHSGEGTSQVFLLDPKLDAVTETPTALRVSGDTPATRRDPEAITTEAGLIIYYNIRFQNDARKVYKTIVPRP